MLSLLAQDDTSITVGTRHFSSALMMKTGAAAGGHYRAHVGRTVTATWTATYTFDAVQGR